MQRAVSSLPLSSGWLSKLASCGFEIIDDLKDVGVIELSRGYYSEDRGFLRNFYSTRSCLVRMTSRTVAGHSIKLCTAYTT